VRRTMLTAAVVTATLGLGAAPALAVPDVELPDVEGLSGGLRDQLRSTDYDDAIAAVDEVLRLKAGRRVLGHATE